MDRLAVARQQPGAEHAQRAVLPDQSEFDRVQVQPAELIDRIKAFGAQPRLAVSDHEIGKHRVGQHR